MHPEACGFLATAAKRQRAEVKLTTLSPCRKGGIPERPRKMRSTTG